MTGVRRVLVVYDSRRGHTERLAGEVVQGAASVPATETRLARPDDITADELLRHDALIVGSPVHTGTVSVPIKKFFDDWQFRFEFYPDRPMQDRVGAAFASGGQSTGGIEATVMTILSAMLHHRMIVVGGVSPVGAWAITEAKPTPIDDEELRVARELGERVARVAHALRSVSGRQTQGSRSSGE